MPLETIRNEAALDELNAREALITKAAKEIGTVDAIKGG
jgi:hypothetical protein